MPTNQHDNPTGEAFEREVRPRHDASDKEYYGALTALDFTGIRSLTLQAPKADTDINILMARMGYKDGSVLPHFHDPKALYGDFSEWPTDPVQLADMMYQGELAFRRLPAELRKRYETPEQLFNFMNDPKNYDEAVKLGLLAQKPKPEPDKFDKLLEKMDTLVSSSTSSDKE